MGDLVTWGEGCGRTQGNEGWEEKEAGAEERNGVGRVWGLSKRKVGE